jgi:outer membrane protein OmpA-like peptidoglycan-associated protein
LLPVVGLLIVAAYALSLFAQDDIQSQVLRETRIQLAANGFDWATVSVSGQDVHLGGAELKEGDGAAALNAARAASCPSWAGRLTCAVQVDGTFTHPVQPPAPASAPPPVIVQACEASLAKIVALSEIEFSTGSSAIAPQSARVLDALAKAVAQCPGNIRVEGHTDSVGGAEENRVLSNARATAVRSALIERGLPAERLVAEGFGASAPIADNKTEAGRARNRRIEFHVVAEKQEN